VETADTEKTARCRGSGGKRLMRTERLMRWKQLIRRKRLTRQKLLDAEEAEETVDAAETAVAEGWFDAGDTKDAVYVEMPARNAQ
jgi:hypothetical protein